MNAMTRAVGLREALAALPRILAVAVLVLIPAMIVHKAYADISALAAKHSGSEFWISLARYFIRNMAGGAG
jgi:hypothetical protein